MQCMPNAFIELENWIMTEIGKIYSTASAISFCHTLLFGIRTERQLHVHQSAVTLIPKFLIKINSMICDIIIIRLNQSFQLPSSVMKLISRATITTIQFSL